MRLAARRHAIGFEDVAADDRRLPCRMAAGEIWRCRLPMVAAGIRQATSDYVYDMALNTGCFAGGQKSYSIGIGCRRQLVYKIAMARILAAAS